MAVEAKRWCGRVTKYGDVILPDLKSVEWAYFAGLIDGEGTINVDAIFKERIQGDSWKYCTFRPSVVLVSTTVELIDWAWNLLPYGSRCTNAAIKSKWKPQRRILWTYRPAIHILKGVLPYLQLKRRQADVVIAMPLSSSGRWGYTEDIREEQKKAWYELRRIRGLTSGRTAHRTHFRIMQHFRETENASGK
jgi:hypothetical protein